MVGFTESELQQLTELKNELLNRPRDYFFKGWNDFSEFKETFISMSSLQWHYLSSGLNLIIEFFKTLGQALYSLVTLQFSIASEQFCSATKAALAAITKLSLDLALLVLHIARLLSLFIATFFPQVMFLAITATITTALFLSGQAVLGFACFMIAIFVIEFYLARLVSKSEASERRCEQKKSRWELNEYYKMENEVYAEKRFIVGKINDVCTEIKQQTELLRLRSESRYKLFSSSSPIILSKELQDHLELARHLLEAVNNYPTFIASQAKKEPGYVALKYCELEEHHEKVKLLADEFFRQCYKNKYEAESYLISLTAKA